MLYYVLSFCAQKDGEPAVATVQAFKRPSEAAQAAIEAYGSDGSVSVKMLYVSEEKVVKEQTVLETVEYPRSWNS